MSVRISQIAALVLWIEVVIVIFFFPSVIYYATGLAAGLLLLGCVLIFGWLIVFGPLCVLLVLIEKTASLYGLQRRAEADASSKGGKQ